LCNENRLLDTQVPQSEEVLHVFYKHMKFRIQARLCLAIYDFEARIMPSLCLTFQGTGLPV